MKQDPHAFFLQIHVLLYLIYFIYRVTLLKRSKKKGDISQVLPQMVKQLEVTLYRSAPSFEHYIDTNTLKERLQAIASEISNDSDDTENRPRVGSGQGNNVPVPGYGQPNNGPAPNAPRSGGMGPSNGAPRGMRPGPGSVPGQRPPYLPQPQMPPQSGRGGTGKELVNLENVNSHMMGGINPPILNPNIEAGMLAPDPQPASGNNIPRGGSRNGSGSLLDGLPDSRSQESRDKLRKQQQRLLLLHHSSKCQADDGKCKATPYCIEMKRLWSHMARCEDYNCRVQHCYSSRTILSHYRKCKDQECLICKPVRQSVWKGKDKAPVPGQRDISTTPYPTGSTNSNTYPHPSPSVPSRPTGPSIPLAPAPYPPPNRIVHPEVPSSTYPNMNPNPVNVASQNPGSVMTPRVLPSSETVGSDREEWSKRIIHKQQRLLLLRHASKCTAEEGKCKVTPHCHSMRLLWKHISNCSKKDCDVAHCISSRYVLMHYRKCKDAKCPSCQPVREAIRQGLENKVHGGDILVGAKRPREPVQPPNINPNANGSISTTSPVINPKRPKTTTEKKAEDDTSTLLKSLTIEQIELHIQSLSQVLQLPPKELKEKCQAALKTLMNHDDGWVFNTPVDPVVLGIEDYFEKIKKPMDLGTIQKRLDNYRDIQSFDSDVRLTFDNAIFYNEPESAVHEMAKNLKELYIGEHSKLIAELKKEEEERRKSDRACCLCGCEKLQFEPPVFFCSGMNCQQQRIHRNRHFYVGSNQYNWCASCYNDLDDSPIHVQDCTIMKKDLVKKKNDEINEENWVQCDACDRWMHQICGLFNPRQNKHDDSVKYTCPKCLIKVRQKTGKTPDERNLIADDLPRTKLSEWLEDVVTEKLLAKHMDLAREKSEAEVSEWSAVLFLSSCSD